MEKPVVDYFMQITKEKFDDVNKRFDRIDTTLEDLKRVKFMWTGGLIVINAAVTMFIAIYFGRV